MNTGHLLGYSYLRDATATRVEIMSLSGEITTYFGLNSSDADQLKTVNGEVVPVPHDSQWECASVTSPWDTGLLEECRERIRRVLLTDDDPATFLREAGPSFVCQKCQGAGRKICVYCAGSRISKRSKKGATCKVCMDSKETPSMVTCDDCEGKGQLEEAEIPAWPCGYCSCSPLSWRCWRSASATSRSVRRGSRPSDS